MRRQRPILPTARCPGFAAEPDGRRPAQAPRWAPAYAGPKRDSALADTALAARLRQIRQRLIPGDATSWCRRFARPLPRPSSWPSAWRIEVNAIATPLSRCKSRADLGGAQSARRTRLQHLFDEPRIAAALRPPRRRPAAAGAAFPPWRERRRRRRLVARGPPMRRGAAAPRRRDGAARRRAPALRRNRGSTASPPRTPPRRPRGEPLRFGPAIGSELF